MKHIHTFESFLNESSIDYVDNKHRDYVTRAGMTNAPVPDNLKELVGKKVKVVKHVEYGGRSFLAAGQEGIIKHAWMPNKDTVVYMLSINGKSAEVESSDVEMIG
jgi:hypothetical protein